MPVLDNSQGHSASAGTSPDERDLVVSADARATLLDVPASNGMRFWRDFQLPASKCLVSFDSRTTAIVRRPRPWRRRKPETDGSDFTTAVA